jgi:hypothetical protein
MTLQIIPLESADRQAYERFRFALIAKAEGIEEFPYFG